MLLVLAVAGVGVYGIVLAGWSSGSTYPLLGGLRSTAQVISYEIAMGLSLVAVFIYSGSMATSAIVDAQTEPVVHPAAFFSFAVYVVTMVGETNRCPFDLAEGEGELIGGFHTEYSLAEVRHVLPRRVRQHVHRLGARHHPVPRWLAGASPHRRDQRRHVQPRLVAGCSGSSSSCWCFMFFFVWLRGSLPRVRYDQFMRFGWKFLIPRHPAAGSSRSPSSAAPSCPSSAATTRQATVIVVGVIAVLALAVAWVWDAPRRAAERWCRRSASEEIDPFAGGYPVPPLPGQRLREPSLAAPAAGTADELTVRRPTRG